MRSYPGPTDLEFSELGPREVQLSWTGPTRPVLQYRVVFHSAEGQSPQEVRDGQNCLIYKTLRLWSSRTLVLGKKLVSTCSYLVVLAVSDLICVASVFRWL